MASGAAESEVWAPCLVLGGGLTWFVFEMLKHTLGKSDLQEGWLGNERERHTETLEDIEIGPNLTLGSEQNLSG